MEGLVSHKCDFNGNSKISLSFLKLYPEDLGAPRGRFCLPQALQGLLVHWG